MMLSPNLDKKISFVLPYACRVDVLNKLAKTEEGLPLDTILNQMIVTTSSIDKHIKGLEKEKLIKLKHGKYYLTTEGKDLYAVLKVIIKKANIAQPQS